MLGKEMGFAPTGSVNSPRRFWGLVLSAKT